MWHFFMEGGDELFMIDQLDEYIKSSLFAFEIHHLYILTVDRPEEARYPLYSYNFQQIILDFGN